MADALGLDGETHYRVSFLLPSPIRADASWKDSPAAQLRPSASLMEAYFF